jgi:hypothetical protein
MTQSLERRLSRLQEKYGENAPEIQWLKDQIAAEQSGQPAQQKYVVGMAKVTAQT